jgi:hypothetical protein
VRLEGFGKLKITPMREHNILGFVASWKCKFGYGLRHRIVGNAVTNVAEELDAPTCGKILQSSRYHIYSPPMTLHVTIYNYKDNCLEIRKLRKFAKIRRPIWKPLTLKAVSATGTPGRPLQYNIRISKCTSIWRPPLCLVVRVLGYTTEMYCDSCEVRNEFIYVM